MSESYRMIQRRAVLGDIAVLAAAIFAVQGCNYREFCDPPVYEEHARLLYIWDRSGADPVPDALSVDFGSNGEVSAAVSSPSDTLDIDLGVGEYDAFAWNEAENISVQDRIIAAATEEDGTLKSVGKLYTGENEFVLHDSEFVKNYAEEDNNHVWNTPPFDADTTTWIKFVEVPMVMVPQTRELRIEIQILKDGLNYIDTLDGILEGIGLTKDWHGNMLTYANAAYSFVLDGDTMYASCRIIGCMPSVDQLLTLFVKFKDGSTCPPFEFDTTEDVAGFNDNLGDEPLVLKYKLEIQKDPMSYTVILKDWDDVESGDNSDLEI